MRKKIHTSSATIEGNDLLLGVDSKISVLDLIPKEQMLVDSDQLAFVYIVEVENEYTYLVLQEELWGTLKEALEKNLTVFLTNREEKQFLPMFMEELHYLIDNITGNSNYGEEMVRKVENTF
jgi:hypothetical protein